MLASHYSIVLSNIFLANIPLLFVSPFFSIVLFLPRYQAFSGIHHSQVTIILPGPVIWGRVICVGKEASAPEEQECPLEHYKLFYSERLHMVVTCFSFSIFLVHMNCQTTQTSPLSSSAFSKIKLVSFCLQLLGTGQKSAHLSSGYGEGFVHASMCTVPSAF